MARERGKENRKAPESEAEHFPDGKDGGKEDQPALSELARRALSLGLSGVLFTESTIRKAIGDTLPKEWSDFAVEQSERTRKEFLERLTYELGQSIEKVDVAAVLAELMRGRTLDISAQIRLVDGQTDEPPEHTFRVRLQGERDDD